MPLINANVSFPAGQLSKLEFKIVYKLVWTEKMTNVFQRFRQLRFTAAFETAFLKKCLPVVLTDCQQIRLEVQPKDQSRELKQACFQTNVCLRLKSSTDCSELVPRFALWRYQRPCAQKARRNVLLLVYASKSRNLHKGKQTSSIQH